MNQKFSSENKNSGHRERLRSRLEKEALALADYEVLELILGLSLKRIDTKPLAKELLLRFGNIRGCFDASNQELLQVPGFGKGLTALWNILRELMARYEADPVIEKKQLASPEAVAKMAMPRLGHLPYEECWIALLNNQHFLLSWERLAKGSINSTVLQPRDILEKALLIKAAGFILVHNHPGGITTPSNSDVVFTKELFAVSQIMGITLLDHVIVTSNDFCSLKETGYLPDK